MSNKILLGIDHGYNCIKSENFCFPSAISRRETLPDDKKGILEYNNYIFDENGEHILETENQDKTTNQDFYLLTLFSIAKELSFKNINDADVSLAVGLPQKYYDRQKDSFKEYLLKNSDKNIYFKYEGNSFNIRIKDVKVFSQGFAALLTADTIDLVKSSCCVVDIGGGTVDIIPISNGMIQASKCKIDKYASNQLQRNLIEAVSVETYENVDEYFIVNYIKKNTHEVPPSNEYEKILQRELCSYTEYIYQLIKKSGINPKITPVIFIGGGAIIMEHFSVKEYGRTKYITDLKANAKGFKKLYQMTA